MAGGEPAEQQRRQGGRAMPADLATVRSWLMHIGALTAGAMDGAEAEARLRFLTDALAYEFPTAAFTPASARAVAGQCAHFPTFGEVLPKLAAWWKAERQPFGMVIDRPALADPFAGSPSEEMSAQEAARAAEWAGMTEGDVKRRLWQLTDHPFRNGLGRVLAIAVRRHCPQHLALLP